ncbi:MAG: hypothetical protein PHO66_00175 [Eubacteriales bacterium]|nr:hypothetical protein [Eubacteriales bacterium]
MRAKPKNHREVYRKFVKWADRAVDVAIKRVAERANEDGKMLESAIKVMDGAIKGMEREEQGDAGITLVHHVPRPPDEPPCE